MKEIINYIDKSEKEIDLMEFCYFCIEKKLWKIVEKNQETILRLIDIKNDKLKITRFFFYLNKILITIGAFSIK